MLGTSYVRIGWEIIEDGRETMEIHGNPWKLMEIHQFSRRFPPKTARLFTVFDAFRMVFGRRTGTWTLATAPLKLRGFTESMVTAAPHPREDNEEMTMK